MRMLVLQGAVAFTIWTGQEAPTEVMEQALRKALAA
jgi:shikimate 5-dehydrogenase